jgi:hypothetical protein
LKELTGRVGEIPPRMIHEMTFDVEQGLLHTR